MTDSPDILDLESGLSRLAGDKELYHQIMEIFFDETEKQIKKMQTAISTNEIEDVQRLAHSIKGAASNLGALRVQETAFNLEIIGNESKIKEAPPVFNKLQNDFKQVKEYWYTEGQNAWNKGANYFSPIQEIYLNF